MKKVVGGLSILFREEIEQELQLKLPEVIDQKPTEQNTKRKAEWESNFKMPLHYPRYTKQQYQDMSERQIDIVLQQYGLAVDGDLACKKQFAIDAFTWDHEPDSEPQLDSKVAWSYSGCCTM